MPAGKDYLRHQRVAAELLRVLGTLLRNEVRDPRLSSISLSEVEVTKDISLARVYFVAADEEAVPEAKDALKKAAGFLRSSAGKMLQMRSVPELRFQYDDSISTGDRVEQLLAPSRQPR